MLAARRRASVAVSHARPRPIRARRDRTRRAIPGCRVARALRERRPASRSRETALAGARPRSATMSAERRRSDGELARTTGRGPTKARTTLGDNGVFVVLQDTLTRGEQTLTDAGEGLAVLDLRRRWQRVMQADASREIEEITGR